MNKDATIIYYTSNQEGVSFERRIKDNILKVTNLPIISISQIPIEFGDNFCVGEVGASGFNMFRQVQKACEIAKTRFVISAEADCLYPPDYFNFLPDRDDVCYRNNNLYVMGQWRKYFYKKNEGATHAQIIGREYYLNVLNKLFKGAPAWSMKERNFPKERNGNDDVFDKVEFFTTENPVVQIKTTRSMRHYTHSDRTPVYKIPYWGKGSTFRNKYYEDN